MPAYQFTDVIESAGDKPINVRAQISVVKTEDGGRQGPFTHGYRPNHNFGGPDDRVFFIGQIEVGEGKWIHPGEECEAVVRFLNVRGLSELLDVGRVWRIQEGPKLVAKAKVIARIENA